MSDAPQPLDLLSDSPRNGEGQLPSLQAPLTPTEAFYIRSNFPTPKVDPGSFRLTVRDLDGRARTYSRESLEAQGPVVTRRVTLECAGNGRTLLTPQPDGTPWTLGATGTATFTGVPLRTLLPELDGAVEVLFTGADRGEKEGWGEIPFQRSLPVDVLEAEHDPLLAWAMNGEPLAPDHGAPLRLVVPGWYAVASVKWLQEITLLAEPFQGYFQTDRYMYVAPAGEESVAPTPVREMRVRALILGVGPALVPGNGAAASPNREGGDSRAPLVVPAGEHRIHGIAWTGAGDVATVDVSVDGGRSWSPAQVDPPTEAFTRVGWSAAWTAEPGRHEIAARATDSAGHTQPLTPFWNALGYGNNVVQRVTIRVE